MREKNVEKTNQEEGGIIIDEIREKSDGRRISGLGKALLTITGASLAIAFLSTGSLPHSPQKTMATGQDVAAEDGAVDEAPKDGDVIEMEAGDTPVLGKASAPILVVEWGDYLCPFTTLFYERVEPQLREQYIKTGKVRFAYRDFPLHGQPSFTVALATRCANEQGKFWEYRDALFEARAELQNQDNIDPETITKLFESESLKRFARELGLNGPKFDTCLDSRKYEDAVSAEDNARKAVKINGTPTTFINGRVINGAQPFENFTKIIDEELQKLSK